MDAMFVTAAFASAEKIINTALTYDPATRIALGKLAPQVLSIKLTAPEVCIYVVPTADAICLLGHYEGDLTTQVQGTVPALMSLFKSDRVNLKDSGVQVIGSSIFLADLQHILKNLDIDWEEMLSQIFGDIVGHQGAELIRNKMQWAKARVSNVTRLTSEFLTEELQALPSKTEVAYFNQQVDEVRLGADRIEARINQMLQKHLQP
jgi:ubiquinone biosynthesis accessory factor UbiJ